MPAQALLPAAARCTAASALWLGGGWHAGPLRLPRLLHARSCQPPGCLCASATAADRGAASPPAAAAAAAAVEAPLPPPEAGERSADERYMRLALEQAAAAAQDGEVPVGAVLVSAAGEVLAAARNAAERSADPTAHAELLCIRSAAAAAGGWRLLDATLYVTLEPCPMCAGALLQARVGTVVYGARNPLLGADGSWIAMLPRAADAGSGACCAGGGATGRPAADAKASPTDGASQPAPAAAARPHPFHPNMAVRRGVLAEECGALMKAFFARRRAEAAAAKSSSGGGGGSSSDSEEC